MELLNAEGPILTANKKNGLFEITDQFRSIIAILNSEQMISFVRGELELVDSQKRIFIYSHFPGSMKPDLKELDTYIGIDTFGKIY
jgi:hypothetical protein